MASNAAHDTALAHRANLNIAAAVVAKLGMGASDSLIGNVINEVRASHPVAELASAGGISGVLGAVDTAIARNTEASRPFNDTDSRAAQLAAQAGSTGGQWHNDGTAQGRYGLLTGSRGSRAAASDGGDDGASGSSGGAGRGASSAVANGTGGEPVGAAFWGTAKGMLLTRGYANDNDMNWAPPDLMKMGRPALQALKESGLKGDGYKALRDPSGLHFDTKTIVHGAGFMKRNQLDYNDASKAANKVYKHPSLNTEERDEVKGATKQAADASNEAEDNAAKERIGKARTRIKARCPEAGKDLDNWAKKYGADKGAGLDAKATAQQGEATAKKDGAEASQKAAQGQAAQQRQDTTKSKLLGMYN